MTDTVVETRHNSVTVTTSSPGRADLVTMFEPFDVDSCARCVTALHIQILDLEGKLEGLIADYKSLVSDIRSMGHTCEGIGDGDE